MNHNELFRKRLAEDRRLVILRFLHEEPDYRLNASLLQDALELVGHKVSRDVIEADGDFLAELDLLDRENIGPVSIFRLTERGADVATGRSIVSGVKRPSPR